MEKTYIRTVGSPVINHLETTINWPAGKAQKLILAGCIVGRRFPAGGFLAGFLTGVPARAGTCITGAFRLPGLRGWPPAAGGHAAG